MVYIVSRKVTDYGKVTGKYRDYRASSIEHAKVLRGELSQKEYNRRLDSSYYYTKDSLYDYIESRFVAFYMADGKYSVRYNFTLIVTYSGF